MKRFFTLIHFILILISCKQSNVEGIMINETLLVHQSFSENNELSYIIKECLNENPQAFVHLKNFNCGGGSGCYDLGYVLTQIIYKIGEENYLNALKTIDKNSQIQLSALICVGLEYGDNNYDGIQDNKNIKTEFPKIYNLTEKR